MGCVCAVKTLKGFRQRGDLVLNAHILMTPVGDSGERTKAVCPGRKKNGVWGTRSDLYIAPSLVSLRNVSA